MDYLALGELLALLIAGIVAMTLSHARSMAKINSGEAADPNLLSKIEALEKKCEQLQGQLNEVNMQLTDEQRQLDLKLTKVLDLKRPNEAALSPERQLPSRQLE